MSETSVAAPASAPSALPRALLIGGGLLGLVAAALAGALVMKSVDTPPPPAAVAAPAARSGQPVPLVAAAAPNALAPANPPMASPAPAPAPAPVQTAPTTHVAAAVCATCGVVESVTPVRKNGAGTGLGAVAGGVVGGVVGHQLGGGNGKSALTVLGAVGGGFAGHEIEKRARSTTLYDVRVRMDDGRVRTFQRAQSMASGTRVTVQGSTLQLAPNR